MCLLPQSILYDLSQFSSSHEGSRPSEIMHSSPQRLWFNSPLARRGYLCGLVLSAIASRCVAGSLRFVGEVSEEKLQDAGFVAGSFLRMR